MASTQSIEKPPKFFWLESGIREKDVPHVVSQEKEFDRASPRERYTPGMTREERKVRGIEANMHAPLQWTYLKVGRRSRERLHVNAPLRGIQVEGFEGALLTQQLNLINVLVSTVVSSPRITFTVLIRQHRTKSIQNSSTGEILRSNQYQTISLSRLFLFDQIAELRIHLLKPFVEISSRCKASQADATSHRTNRGAQRKHISNKKKTKSAIAKQ